MKKKGGKSLLIFLFDIRNFQKFLGSSFFIFKSFYDFRNIILLYNTSPTLTIIFQRYFFSDNNISDYSKEEEVSSEGNEDSGRYFSIQLDQLKLMYFQVHPVLVVLF